MNRNFKIMMICCGLLFFISVSVVISVIVTKSAIKENQVANNRIQKEISKNYGKSETKKNQPKNSTNQNQSRTTEKTAYQKFSSEITKGTDSADRHWKEWIEILENYDAGIIDDNKMLYELEEIEQKMSYDKSIIANAPVGSSVSRETQNQMNQIKQGYQDWIDERKKCMENYRIDFTTGNLTQETILQTQQIIGRSNEILFDAVQKTIDLGNKFK